MHCECPKGFAGVHCEYTAKICGVGEHMCLGNSTCVKDDNGYRCECDQANNDTGRSCQHHDTEFCTPAAPHIEYSGGMAIAAFCVNDGKCNDVVLGGEVYVVKVWVESRTKPPSYALTYLLVDTCLTATQFANVLRHIRVHIASL